MLAEWSISEQIGRWIWLFIVAGCVVWYGTITVYVAIRGFGDIKTMLTELARGGVEAVAEVVPEKVRKAAEDRMS